jgi:hypothetical protein
MFAEGLAYLKENGLSEARVDGHNQTIYQISRAII